MERRKKTSARKQEEWSVEQYRAFLAQKKRPAAAVGRTRKPLPVRTQWEDVLAEQLRRVGLVACREYRFHPKRRWRFDFAFPTLRIALEVEGGIYSGGRHTRGKGYESDCEKYNEALVSGWKVLRFTPGLLKKDLALPAIVKVVEERCAHLTVCRFSFKDGS